jgi:DNA-binding CsgD family transcriptional regulator/tetratricopeptide (TPR) repeat protein
VALVRGDPGIGKTSLLGDVRGLGVRRGAVVIRSSVTEVESGIGWSGLATLMRGVDPELRELASGPHLDVLDAIAGPTVGDAVDPLGVASALSEVLRSLAQSRPLLVVLDDLHWFDQATAAALSFAVRLLADLPILVVAGARPVPLPIDVERIVGADDLVVIEPAPLSLGGARELLASRFSVQIGHIELVRLHELSQGNPLHLTETGRLIQAGVPVADAMLPASLRALIDTNLDRLEDMSREVLAACAIMPRARLDLLYQLFDVERVEGALVAGERLDLVHVDELDGDVVLFRHPLLRSRLGEGLPLMERRQLHRRCAGLDVPVEVRAMHLGASIVGTDPRAADVLDEAVDVTLRSGVLEAALRHAERALALTDPTDLVATRRRTLQAADIAASAGEPGRALELVEPLIAAIGDDGPLPDDAPALLILAGRAHSAAHGAGAALPFLERAVALLPEGSPQRARQLSNIVMCLLFVDVDQARERCLEFVDAAATAGDSTLQQIAHAVHCVAETASGLPILPSSEPPAAAFDPGVAEDWLAVAVWTDDLARGDELLTEALHRLADQPSIVHEHNVLMQGSDLRYRQGRLDEAAMYAERAWALADAVEGGSGRSSDLAVISAVRGDGETARRYATILESALADLRGGVARGEANFAIGVVAALDGDHRRAVDHLTAAVTDFDVCGVRDLGARPLRASLLDALMQAGDLDEAERVAAEIVELAERSGRPRGAAEAFSARAHVAAGRGRLEEAAELASSAIDTFEQIGLPVERARTLVLAASIARRSRRRTEARTLLDDAHGELVRCGALGWLPRVHAERERLGDRGDADTLTKTEGRIADLVAAGMTNAEVAAQLYVSARTVESHLTQIYRKEGVRNRSELAARRRP